MAISNTLYMALLSMDAYNRAYGQGLDVVAAGASATQLGNATIGLNSTDLAAGIPSGIAAGFFAQSYTLNGQTIISYRGTDDQFTLSSFISSFPSSDVWNGYGTAFGSPYNDQARMAAEFFQTVTGTQNTNPADGNAILTGHSLGGGLAGLIAAIYGQQATLFDNMPFEVAAANARAYALAQDALGVSILTDFYNGFAPPPITSTASFADGSTSTIANVILTNNQIDTHYLGDSTVSGTATANDNFFFTKFLNIAA